MAAAAAAPPLIRYFLVAFLLVSLASKGLCQCSLQNITIGTERTWRVVQGKDEWKVSVINECDCPQQSVVVSCRDFQTTEPVDPNIFVKTGRVCLINRGRPITPHSSVEFFYAWDPPFIFVPVSSKPNC